MRLNLGCGFDNKADWINVDKIPMFEPGELVDLEGFPWPWADDSVEVSTDASSAGAFGRDHGQLSIHYQGVMADLPARRPVAHRGAAPAP
jgi:hypothetical protein